MLAGAIATGVLAPGGTLTFDLQQLAAERLPQGSQDWIFLCFAAAFLVKMPAFPLHGWMPDGYRAMPLPVLAVFSGVLSKVAAYGFLQVAIRLFPDAAARYQELIMLIALASILYGSVLAFTVNDTRLILGYSSVAQLGFITLGIFSLTAQGAQGGILQAVNHGLVVVPAFFILALLAARARGSENLRDMGGLALRAPVLAALFLVVALANLAMPGSSNFVGEFLILLGTFNSKLVLCLVAATGVALAAVYTLRLFIGAMHNRARAAGRVAGDERCATASSSSRSSPSSSPSPSTRRSRCTRASATRARPSRPRARRSTSASSRRARGGLAMTARPHRGGEGAAHRLGRAVAARGAARRRDRRAHGRAAALALLRELVVPLLALATFAAAAGLGVWQWGEGKDLVTPPRCASTT